MIGAGFFMAAPPAGLGAWRKEILVRSLSSGRPPVGPGGQAQDEDFVRTQADSRPHPELVEGRGRLATAPSGPHAGRGVCVPVEGLSYGGRRKRYQP
ncbi:hypothetical protein CA607_14890 [Caulobacter vibrioides]|nr:hypothetical protein CA607_14890 [Caulobacter vibrioides]